MEIMPLLFLSIGVMQAIRKSLETAKLTAQKDALEKALDDLKAAQTQLVHAEKMASLEEGGTEFVILLPG